MNKRVTIQFADFIKSRLAGGLLCCLVLLAAYLFQMFFPGMYVDAFSSSFYLFAWLILFVGALLWTLREKGTSGLPSEITDWQCIAAFLLIVANQIYVVMPKEVHVELAPVISACTLLKSEFFPYEDAYIDRAALPNALQTLGAGVFTDYTLPVLVIVSLAIAGIVKLSISFYRSLEIERQKTILQEKRLQELLSSPPPVLEGVIFVRRLLENQSIYQLTASENLTLIEGCRAIDPDFFVWLKDKQIKIPPRHIVYCVLIRMRKTKKEILSIFDISDGACRAMRSRVRASLGIEDEDMETFLQELH